MFANFVFMGHPGMMEDVIEHKRNDHVPNFRLEVAKVNLRGGDESQRRRIPDRFHRNRNKLQTKSGVEYSHHAPIVISAPDTKIHKAREDPAEFYSESPVVITAKHYKPGEDVPYKVQHSIVTGNLIRKKHKSNLLNDQIKSDASYARRYKTKSKKFMQRHNSYQDNNISGMDISLTAVR
jgi:hypothetical protein